MVVDHGPNGNQGAPSPARPATGYQRTPPQNLEAEVAVLGAALLSRSALAEVIELVRPEDFYRSSHRTIYEAILELFRRGEVLDPITIVDQLQKSGKLDDVGGASAIHDLVASVPTAANAMYYARIVSEKALLRRLIEAGTEVVGLGYDAGEDVNLTVDRAEQLIYDISSGRVGSEYSALKELLSEGFERIEQRFENRSEVTGLATGLDDFDRLTAGLQKQNLVIVAARPAMGKCVAGSTRVTEAKTGAVRTIAEIVESGGDGGAFQVLSLGASSRLHPTTPSEFHDNGIQETFTLRTRRGREIRATANHPFLTPAGWKPLERIAPGDLVAVPRVLDVCGTEESPTSEVALLGYFLGGGSSAAGRPVIVTESARVTAELRRCARAFGTRLVVSTKGGARARSYGFSSPEPRPPASDVAARAGISERLAGQAPRDRRAVSRASRALVEGTVQHPGYEDGPARDPVAVMLERHGLLGLNSHQRSVPEAIFRLRRWQVALFLSRLFSCGGRVRVSGHYHGISYSSVSERLIHDVRHLLLRFGISAYVREKQVEHRGVRRLAYELEIRDAAQLRTFIEEIGIHSEQDRCRELLALVAETAQHTDVDLLPTEVWELILHEKGDRSWTEISAATGRPLDHDWHVGRRRPSRQLVAELADALGSERLREAASSDLHWDRVASIGRYGFERVYDLTIPQLHNFVANDIVVHNSSLSLGITQYVTVNLQRPAIIFSLEMSKAEIVDRVLSSEARVDSFKIRNGRLDDADWASLSDAMGRLADAPLFIDDTAAITMMEIRAKCRRLKARYGLELVVVDYLQLMQSHRRTESRQQEVSEISRGLKMLAKELDVPVLALSQLSRQPESRTDKRPQLSDLRESGCLTADTQIVRADTGQHVSMGELHARGETDIPVWTLGGDLRLRRGLMTHVFSSGVKEIFELQLRSGRAVTASANHPFLAPLRGWTRLDELTVGGLIAIPEIWPVIATDHDPGRDTARRGKRRAGASRFGGSSLIAGGSSLLGRTAPEPLASAVAVLDPPPAHGSTDVYWDEIVAIEPCGTEEVFDATVPGTHNFIADGVVVHNSIEQDADVVSFIYRDEVYDPDSMDKGVAELIVAKHRNGPTGVVKLAFLDHYTKFANLARTSI